MASHVCLCKGCGKYAPFLLVSAAGISSRLNRRNPEYLGNLLLRSEISKIHSTARSRPMCPAITDLPVNDFLKGCLGFEGFLILFWVPRNAQYIRPLLGINPKRSISSMKFCSVSFAVE
jgi:hypothetical protein